jgi:hypothetical protein
MNLHAIAGPIIAAVNPFITCTLQASTGYTTNADGRRVPSYADPVSIACQVQPLQYTDILKLEGLNIQGVRSKVYIAGKWQGHVRPDQVGGDLLTMPDGTVWLVAVVMEDWPDWCVVTITRQMPTPA